MTEEDQLKKIVDGLKIWAERNKGSVKIAHDVPHMFKILGDAPGAARAAVMVVGETPRNDTYSDIEVRMDRRFWIGVSRGYTLESYPGKSLVDGIAGGKPMFTLIREAKIAVRNLRFDTDEDRPYYKGYELMTFEGIVLDAYRLEISVTTDDLLVDEEQQFPNIENED